MSAKLTIEDTFAAILDQLQQMNTLLGLVVGDGAQRGGGSSSVTVEDMSKGRPKITTKRYTGSEPEIAQAIEDHAAAVQLAEAAWKSDWKTTYELLVLDGSGKPIEPQPEPAADGFDLMPDPPYTYDPALESVTEAGR